MAFGLTTRTWLLDLLATLEARYPCSGNHFLVRQVTSTGVDLSVVMNHTTRRPVFALDESDFGRTPGEVADDITSMLVEKGEFPASQSE